MSRVSHCLAVKAESWEVGLLHGGLVLCNFIWSWCVARGGPRSATDVHLSLHILMSYPLRKGASAAVLSFLREVVGFVALVRRGWTTQFRLLY